MNRTGLATRTREASREVGPWRSDCLNFCGSAYEGGDDLQPELRIGRRGNPFTHWEVWRRRVPA